MLTTSRFQWTQEKAPLLIYHIINWAEIQFGVVYYILYQLISINTAKFLPSIISPHSCIIFCSVCLPGTGSCTSEIKYCFEVSTLSCKKLRTTKKCHSYETCVFNSKTRQMKKGLQCYISQFITSHLNYLNDTAGR